MKLNSRVIEDLMVSPGEAADLGHRSTKVTKSGWLDAKDAPSQKDLAEEDLEEFKDELVAAQELLYATGTYALLVVLQALDEAGKDGTIKHVMSGVNPQGRDVVAFKRPSAEKLDHDFLWRCERELPGSGRIGIFNRSYYEEVEEVRYLAHRRQLDALDRIPVIAAEFAEAFGRDSSGLLHTYRTDDAETIVVALGSVLGTVKDAADVLREAGERVGVVGITYYSNRNSEAGLRDRSRPSARDRSHVLCTVFVQPESKENRASSAFTLSGS